MPLHPVARLTSPSFYPGQIAPCHFSRCPSSDPEFLLGQPLHPDEEPAAVSGSPGPPLNMLIERSPTTQVEVADAEVCAVRNLHGFGKCRAETLFDVVEDPGHQCGRSRGPTARHPDLSWPTRLCRAVGEVGVVGALIRRCSSPRSDGTTAAKSTATVASINRPKVRLGLLAKALAIRLCSNLSRRLW